MAKTDIPRALPDCELIQILAERASQRHDIDFNFLGRLDAFRERVSGEVRQINQLFPEYTPHDEQYHLKRLFHVACTVLGKDRLEMMNSAELFVLAVGLYGHDWGMAVSDTEKQYIVTGKPPGDIGPDDLWILPNEQASFTRFVREQQLPVDASECMEEIPVGMWREYVRQTHASRSGERVRRYFESIDGGVADAASRVCEGHWLGFEDLKDADSYPVNFSVLREQVNLRAIAVYVRLIDLLDLAEDRTPYVIWKFVAPRDPHSKMEWEKHRALRPVTCPSYQEGRVILVDGSTDDHEVYAALEDLRIWCEKQLRVCNDLLARMNDPRHRLDLYHIHWRVIARGFKPVLIQFEFDRERMFEILGDEIYQGDPYVFLRELLQNSIDAIRMRREVLQRNGIAPGNFGVIRVTVEHGDSGDVKITWQDDGVGMDEFIVRNYFAVAGNSYYRSVHFEREGLKLDPISRFGIGILSCFMVADRIEIETRRDPYLPPASKPLRITIPAMHRQFRIETLPQECAEIGTTVQVFVEGKKLPMDEEDKTAKQLDVTAYLSFVAGFVEFPIVIIEGDHKTIILHPDRDAQKAQERFGEEFKVHQLELTYPWTEAFVPQDFSLAREIFREEYVNLSARSGLTDYSGALTYVVPYDQIDILSAREQEAMVRGQPEIRMRAPRTPPEWGVRQSKRGISRSSRRWIDSAVYRDGILLPAVSRSSFRRAARVNWPAPNLVLDIPKSSAPRVDLARTHVLEEREYYDKPVRQAHLRRLSEELSHNLLMLDPAERWYQLGRLVAFHYVSAEDLWQVFPHESWPLLFLRTGGYLDALEWQEIATGPVYICPRILSLALRQECLRRWLTQPESESRFVQWSGEQCVVPSLHGASLALDAATGLWRPAVRESHRLTAIRFLRPPWEGNPPIFQDVWVPAESPEEPHDIEAILEMAIEDPAQLSHTERRRLRATSDLGGFPDVAAFPKPFDGFFAYAWNILNLSHPITQAILRVVAAYELSRRREALHGVQLGQLQDVLLDLCQILPSARLGVEVPVHQRDCKIICDVLRDLWSLAGKLRLLEIGDTKDLMPTYEEFVPGTVVQNGSEPIQSSISPMSPGKIEIAQPFGEPIV